MKTFDISVIDNTWTLFLDRDGVINKRLHDDYVKNVSEFGFLPGVPDALKTFSEVFGKIIVVTNQQGIGKGIYTAQQLNEIHAHMVQQVHAAGGHIDAVFFAPNLASENSPLRKPGIGMALQAKAQFPEIDFSRSLMIGDSVSDLEFGRTAGMRTMFVYHDERLAPQHQALCDREIHSLAEAAELLQSVR
jgi:histidinol-phosphate phosphatase family protein